MVILAVNGIFSEIVQGIVHPAHVPFHAESKAANIGGLRNHRPGGRLFRNHLDIGKCLIHLFVEALQERDRFQVFPSAETVGNPVSVVA